MNPQTIELKVRSNGKVFLFFYFISLVGLPLISFYIFNLWGAPIDELIFSLLLLFIPAIIAVPLLIAEIRRKNIPSIIRINEADNSIHFTFRKRRKNDKTVQLLKNEVAYHYRRSGMISSITIYYKIRARRGHIVEKKYFMIIGSIFGIGWSNAKLAKLNYTLQTQGYEQKKVEETSLVDAFFN